jgi:tRNA U34 5-methylaminomethyl-2-thiouridine-forming methyltransferase MnmC
MHKTLVVTDDGSHTLYVPDLNETYHSTRGAMVEANYVYLEKGLFSIWENKTETRVLEIGFGTGLNALLSMNAASLFQKKIVYISIEPFPLKKEEWSLLNYAQQLNKVTDFTALHELPWGSIHHLNPFFSLQKNTFKLQEVELLGLKNCIDVIYFDAFAPNKQPDLWSLEIFSLLQQCLVTGGVLVTYSAQSKFRKTLQSLGFDVQKHKGPPGKLEMTVAIKL